jgi:hypothetical protein
MRLFGSSLFFASISKSIKSKSFLFRRPPLFEGTECLRVTRSLIVPLAMLGALGFGVSFATYQERARAEDISPEDLGERIVERRAVEAFIWGLPAVNTDLMRQEMLTRTSGKVGEVIYWGKPLDWHNQTLTPNPDALYFMTFFDLKDGPVVLDLPAAEANGSFNGNIVTIWQMPLEDAGLLGADKGAGGKYS